MNNKLDTVTTIAVGNLLDKFWSILINCTGLGVQLHLPLDMHTQVINTNGSRASTLKETWPLTIWESPWSLMWSRHCHFIEINVTALSMCYTHCFQIIIATWHKKITFLAIYEIMLKTHHVSYFTVFTCWLHFHSYLTMMLYKKV